MTKVLALYYSSYGYTERMARAVAEGAGEAGAEVAIRRAPELVPESVARASRYRLALARFQGEHVARIAGRLKP